jgi:hypothetical protein
MQVSGLIDAQHQSHDRRQQYVRTPQRVRRHCSASSHQSDRGREGKPDGFGHQQTEGQGISVARHQQEQIHQQSWIKKIRKGFSINRSTSYFSLATTNSGAHSSARLISESGKVQIAFRADSA